MNLGHQDLSIPPDIDQIEISVFGPGYGECIVIHPGDGLWLIIDSCTDSASKLPKALEYLSAVGVNPESNVRLIVATHWHDDHVRGLSKVVETCEAAIFCCASALADKDFFSLASLYSQMRAGMPSGPIELRESIKLAATRSKAKQRAMLKFAKADTLLWQHVITAGCSPISATLTALSPSDEMHRRSLEFMAASFAAAQSSTPPATLIAARPNDVAIALLLKIGSRNILLGSDLESGKDPLVGWSAAIGSLASQKSEAFKVAHHGSKSGHDDNIWSQMLITNPLSLITPFRWGRHCIPTSSDRARILSLTNRAFISAHPDIPKTPKTKRPLKVQTLITNTLKNRRIATGPIGHIRWRVPISDPSDAGSIELFEGALSLTDTI